MTPNFYTITNVGIAKYIVNYHDGEKTLPDGSPFYDIAILKNKRQFKMFANDLISKGYIECILW